MKTTMIIAAALAVIPYGCRAPRSLGSAGEPRGRTLAEDETASAPDPRTLPAAMAGMQRPAAQSNLPVSELLARAEQSIHAQQLVVARSHLQSILIQQPEHPRAHHLLAVISDLDGRYIEAEQHYFSALAQDPYNASIVGDLGYSYYLQSRFQESEQYLHRALELNPQHGGAAKNLAQLYTDRGELEQAEHLLQATLSPTEVELALQYLRRRQPAAEDASLLSGLMPGRNRERTGAELTEQIREQMDAAARAEVAAREQGSLEREYREASMAQADPAAAPMTQSDEEAVSINPWSRQLSGIDASGAPATAPTLVIGPGRRDVGAAIPANSPATGGAIQSVGGQTPAEELPSIQPAIGSRSGVERNSVAATSATQAATSQGERRWPPATWAPLTDPATQPQGAIPEPYPGSAPPDIQQLSGSINPWNVDVRHAVGRGGRPDVQRAHFDSALPADAAVATPVTAHGPNTPAAVPASPTTTPRSVPETDSYWNDGQYPPAQRNLPGSSADRPTAQASMPTPYDSYQSVRQPYNQSMNDRVDGTYGQSPSGRTPSPASAGSAPAHEVPTYPYGSAAGAAPPVSPQTETPWPSRAATAPAQPGPQTVPVVAPDSYRAEQQPVSPTAGAYERYPGVRGY